jgi:hypothetical protein
MQIQRRRVELPPRESLTLAGCWASWLTVAILIYSVSQTSVIVSSHATDVSTATEVISMSSPTPWYLQFLQLSSRGCMPEPEPDRPVCCSLVRTTLRMNCGRCTMLQARQRPLCNFIRVLSALPRSVAPVWISNRRLSKHAVSHSSDLWLKPSRAVAAEQSLVSTHTHIIRSL